MRRTFAIKIGTERGLPVVAYSNGIKFTRGVKVNFLTNVKKMYPETQVIEDKAIKRRLLNEGIIYSDEASDINNTDNEYINKQAV